MNRLLCCVVLGLIGGGVGCDSRSETDTYRVTLSDEDGAPVYAGDLWLQFDAEPNDGPQVVAGRWRLAAVGSAPLPASSGEVAGHYLGAGVGLTLGAGASDAGLELSGTRDPDRIVGRWAELTIAGPVPRGTFEALRE